MDIVWFRRRFLFPFFLIVFVLDIRNKYQLSSTPHDIIGCRMWSLHSLVKHIYTSEHHTHVINVNIVMQIVFCLGNHGDVTPVNPCFHELRSAIRVNDLCTLSHHTLYYTIRALLNSNTSHPPLLFNVIFIYQLTFCSVHKSHKTVRVYSAKYTNGVAAIEFRYVDDCGQR